MRLIQPILTDRFTCLAGKCPTTCCQNWNVVWREKEINHLRSAGNKELTAKLPDCFEGEGEYKKIKMDENGKCPFLTEKGLCEIHKNLGKNFLSYTCREYPKIARVCGDIIIRSCKTSCFAVMEMLCHSKNCMKTEQCSAEQLHAVVSPVEDGAKRARLFLAVKELFGMQNFIAEMEVLVEGLDGVIVEDTAEKFKEIFGIEIIEGKEDLFLKKFGNYAINNIIKAVYWEWMIAGWESELTITENISCFLFFAKAVRMAADGIVTKTKNESEIICSLCDIISVILSEKNTTMRTWESIKSL